MITNRFSNCAPQLCNTHDCNLYVTTKMSPSFLDNITQGQNTFNMSALMEFSKNKTFDVVKGKKFRLDCQYKYNKLKHTTVHNSQLYKAFIDFIQYIVQLYSVTL